MRSLLGLPCVAAVVGPCRRFGALTNKPYAFAFRAWELESVFTPQPFDPWLDDVRVDVRGTQPLRTLPVRSGPIELNWLPDSTRFAFDGLQYQRQTGLDLYLPGPDRDAALPADPVHAPPWAFGVGWMHYLGATVRQSAHRAVLGTLLREYAPAPGRASHASPVYFPAPLADLQDRAAALAWGAAMGGLEYASEAASYPLDAPRPCDVPPLSELLHGPWGTVLLAGIDVRAEFPKVYLLLRRLQRSPTTKSPLRVFSIGPARQPGLRATHLGSDLSILLATVSGRHWLSGVWMRRFRVEQCRHLVFVGASLWCDVGGALRPGVLRLLDLHYGVNVYPLFPHVGWLADLYLGVCPSQSRFSNDTRGLPPARPRLTETDCVLFPGRAVVELTPYVPAAGQAVLLPTLVLPAPAPFLERESVYMSHAGRIVRTIKALAPPADHKGVMQCREQHGLLALLARLLLGRKALFPAHPLARSWAPGRVTRCAPRPERTWPPTPYYHHRVQRARAKRTKAASLFWPHVLAAHSMVLRLAGVLAKAGATNYPGRGL